MDSRENALKKGKFQASKALPVTQPWLQSRTPPSRPPCSWLSTPGRRMRWSSRPWRDPPQAWQAPASSCPALWWCWDHFLNPRTVLSPSWSKAGHWLPSYCQQGWWERWGRNVSLQGSTSLEYSPSCPESLCWSTWGWRLCRGRIEDVICRSLLVQQYPRVPAQPKKEKGRWFNAELKNICIFSTEGDEDDCFSIEIDTQVSEWGFPM